MRPPLDRAHEGRRQAARPDPHIGVSPRWRPETIRAWTNQGPAISAHRRTWQRAEERAAALFGAVRQIGSGLSGRADATRFRSTRPSLFIETKHRPRHAVRSLFDSTGVLARNEGKTAVLMLADKGRPGMLVCCHSDDLEALAVACCAAHATDELPGKIRAVYDRLHGFD